MLKGSERMGLSWANNQWTIQNFIEYKRMKFLTDFAMYFAASESLLSVGCRFINDFEFSWFIPTHNMNIEITWNLIESQHSLFNIYNVSYAFFEGEEISYYATSHTHWSETQNRTMSYNRDLQFAIRDSNCISIILFCYHFTCKFMVLIKERVEPITKKVAWAIWPVQLLSKWTITWWC